MFCPQCQAEYLPHVLRCSDCDVPLVEHLHVTHSHSDSEAISGVAVLKELGPIIAIPFVCMGTLLLWVATLRDNPWSFQILSPIPHTYAVFLFVFCDTGRRGRRDLKGYNLREKAVREKLPLLLYIHAGILTVMFAGATGAIWVRHRLSLFRGSDEPYLYMILGWTGFTIAIIQIIISRKILERALKTEVKSRGS
jgi:hypothetical protein